jgi:hypothetical protein
LQPGGGWERQRNDATGRLCADGLGGAGEITPVSLTLTETAIDGLPADLAAGIVDVTVTDETGGAAGATVNFTLVEPGTDPATFVEGISAVISGGPFPDFFLNTAGVVGHTMTTLDEGEYIAWMDLANSVDRPSTPDDIIAVPLTVGPATTTRSSLPPMARSGRATISSTSTYRQARAP